MNMGPIGIIIVGIIGLMGGVIGSYFSIRKTHGPKEKAYITKIVIAGWIGIIVFLALLSLTPPPYSMYLFVALTVILTITIIKGNKIQAKIRKEEANNRKQ